MEDKRVETTATEAVVVEAEETEQGLQAQETMSMDGMDKVIQVAGKMDAYAKAMDTIINVVVKRSYAGDWVCHAKESDAVEKKAANIGSAAAERIAVFLGIQEKNWTKGEKIMSNDGRFFTWRFEADFGFGGRWVHAIGQAGSRDKFFGYAHKQWKAIDDVEEDDIRMAAFRACRKEGVRSLFGLRSIPLSKLKELGYNLDHIAYASFSDKEEGKKLTDEQKKADASGFVKRQVKIKESKMGWEGPKNVRFDVVDTEGVKYSFFANKDSRRALILDDAKQSQSLVELLIKVEAYQGREQYTIIQINGTGDK